MDRGRIPAAYRPGCRKNEEERNMQTVEGMNIELGPYKGLKVEKPKVSVSEAELAAAVRQAQKSSTKPVDVSGRAVRLGDVAVIDFAGYREGKLFDGGSGTDYPLEIGSGAFIPGFEEQLVGAETGQQVDVNVTFPQDYGAPDLAGQDALFKVTVKKIQEYQYPEMTEQAKKEMEEKLRTQKEQFCEEQFESALIREIVQNSTIEISEIAMARESETMLGEWKALMRMNKIDPDQYFQMTGLNDQKIKEQLKSQTEQRLRSRLVLEAVAQAEQIEATEEDIEKELDELASQYGLPKETVREKLNEGHFDAMKSNIRVRGAMEVIKANAGE